MPPPLRARTLLAQTCDGETTPSGFGFLTKPRTIALEKP